MQHAGSQEQNDPDVVDIARRLVMAASPNLPGDEREVAAVVADVQREFGLPAPHVISCEDHRPNLITTIDFGAGGRHLVLNGHIDTKPIGDATWSVDPFAATIDGDRLYGLGSADMKGAVAAMLDAAHRVLQSPPPRGRLSLLFTADEENGAEYGAQYVVRAADLDADAVVIGEPGGIAEDWDNLHLVSRGIARLLMTATARQGHSSLSELLGERNAGVDIARLIAAVVDDLDLPIPDNPAGLSGWSATLNAGLKYTGGVGYGVLPDGITAVTEVRVLPGMNPHDVLSSFRAIAQQVADRSGATYDITYDAAPNDWLDATIVDADAPIVASAQRACDAALGTVPPLGVFPGTTDSTWFGSVAKIPTLPALGPGLLRRCHGADEWVSVAAVRQAVDVYTALVADFCLGEEA